MKKFKEFFLSVIYGKKCPRCGTRNHVFINDPIWDYNTCSRKCIKCGCEY